MPNHDTTESGARIPPAAAGDRPSGPQQPAGNDVPASGSGRRDFFLTVALAAAALGCRGSPPPSPPARSATPAPPPEPADLSQDIRAIRAHVLKLEAPPSFVFSVRFRDVP